MHTARTWIEINQTYFDHNVAHYKNIIDDRYLSIVVKANAYGHGISHIAHLAQHNSDIHSFCVATIQEAVFLRNSGITKPIFMIGVLDSDIHCIINKQVTLSVHDMAVAKYIQSIGKAYNTIFHVHIKIDTGLSRLGISPHDAYWFIQNVQKFSHIKITGIYSHCAESQAQDDTFTRFQLDTFKNLIAYLQQHHISFPFVHFANSAATSSLALSFCNLFRVGIGIYGSWPSLYNKKITNLHYPTMDLKPILTWKTVIRAIKIVQKGQYIGYDRTYQAHKRMRIALIPVGYYDGYDFRLYNKGYVRVQNAYAPIVGRISMNMCSIDISDITAQLHDEVILMGPYSKINPFELAFYADNPNVRAVTTTINTEIPRRIVKNNTPLENAQEDGRIISIEKMTNKTFNDRTGSKKKKEYTNTSIDPET